MRAASAVGVNLVAERRQVNVGFQIRLDEKEGSRHGAPTVDLGDPRFYRRLGVAQLAVFTSPALLVQVQYRILQ